MAIWRWFNSTWCFDGINVIWCFRCRPCSKRLFWDTNGIATETVMRYLTTILVTILTGTPEQTRANNHPRPAEETYKQWFDHGTYNLTNVNVFFHLRHTLWICITVFLLLPTDFHCDADGRCNQIANKHGDLTVKIVQQPMMAGKLGWFKRTSTVKVVVFTSQSRQPNATPFWESTKKGWTKSIHLCLCLATKELQPDR